MTTSSRLDVAIEWFVRLKIFLLAAFYAVKELYFEYNNQGIAAKLNTEISESSIIRQARKVAVVTGADGTIGLEITRKLLFLGFDVKALVKNRQETFLANLAQDYKRKLVLYELNLENPRQVASLLESFESLGTINLIVLCAGIMFAEEKYIEGMESHMCINFISQAVLLDGLQDHFNSDTRIIAVSSSCMRAAYKQLNPETLFQQYYGPYQAYALSKLTLSIYISELANKTGLKVASVHPGVVPGRLYRHVNIFLKLLIYICLPFIMRTPSFSAQLVLHTAVRHDLVPGSYYEDQEAQTVLSSFSQSVKKDVYNTARNKIKELRQ